MTDAAYTSDTDVRRVSELTVNELRTMIRETVLDTLLEMTEGSFDPDEGLSFRPEFEERLLRFLREQPEGQPIDEVARELGLDV